MYGEYRSTAYFQGQGVDLLKQAGITGLEADSGSGDRQPAGVHFFRLLGFSGNAGDGRPKWQNRGQRSHRQRDLDQGQTHPEIRRRDPSLQHLFTDSRTHNGSYSFTGVSTENPQRLRTGDAFADWMLGFPGQRRRARIRPPGGADTAPTGTSSFRTISK